ncbi:MAG TPA: HAD family phosphatase [Eggerthellaceae bacterium]|nr:HAD family phosphatase [Eggerthellaceae bacterium]
MFDFSKAAGFIFDCDGTLIDALDAWERAEEALFAQTGPLTQEQEDEIHSAPIERAAETFHERYGVGESTESVLRHLDGHLLPFYGERSAALPGAVEFVRAVAERGIPCVVVSSSPRRYLEAGLVRAGILACFRDLVTTDEVGCSKQEPGIYDRALQVLGTEACRTWAVDDAPYAICAMHRFGLKTICVGERTSPHADIDVVSLAELL